MKKMAVFLFLTFVLTFSSTLSVQGGADDGPSFICDHGASRPPSASDPALHDRCAGIVVPFEETDILQPEVEISVRPVFWMCLVENYDFIVDCQFTFTNPTADALTATLAFPFSTHDIYGDHNEFETVNIFEGEHAISYLVALNVSLYSLAEEGLSFNGHVINSIVHPLLEGAYDMAEVAPRLYADDFEMIAFWDITLGPGESKTFDISFTHFSGFACCYEDKNHFIFDVTNAGYWKGPIEFSGTCLKTLRYESLSTSLDVIETENAFLLTGTDLNEKIDIRVLGGLLTRGCLRSGPAICQSPLCCYLDPDPGYEEHVVGCDVFTSDISCITNLLRYEGCHVEVTGHQGWCSPECPALIIDNLVLLHLPVTLSVEDAFGYPGGTVPINICSDNPQDLEELHFTVKDGDDWLTAIDVQTTDRTSGLAVDFQDTEEEVSISIVSQDDAVIAPGNGPIIRIIYAVNANARLCDSTSVDVSKAILSNEQGESRCLSTESGRFLGWYCPTILKGDLNLDCVLDIRDAVLMVNYVLAPDEPLLYPPCILDCDGDGMEDIRDVLCIVNCILDIGTCPPTCHAMVTPAVIAYLETLASYLSAEHFSRFMALVKPETQVPAGFNLVQNYPNPFNPTTHMRYEIPDGRFPAHITLTIFNVLGQQIRTLVDEVHEPGYYTVTWDGKDSDGRQAGSGIYLYRFTVNGGQWSANKRMVLMK